MEMSLMESIILTIKVIAKMLGMMLHSALIGIVLIVIGTIIFNHKKIIKALRKISAIN